MRANQAARERRADLRSPDGGQLLLLAGFLLAGAAIIAIGTLHVVKRTEVQVVEESRSSMVDLFVNSRTRSIEFFSTVVTEDTPTVVEARLDDYLGSQYRTARALALELNATLAADGSITPDDKREDQYVSGGFYTVCSYDDTVCYTTVPYDGVNDGLILDSSGRVLAAIFYLEVRAPNTIISEVLVIDVPST